MFEKIESIIKRQLSVVNGKLAKQAKEYDVKEIARLLFTDQLKLNKFLPLVEQVSDIDYDFSKILIDAFY